MQIEATMEVNTNTYQFYCPRYWQFPQKQELYWVYLPWYLAWRKIHKHVIQSGDSFDFSVYRICNDQTIYHFPDYKNIKSRIEKVQDYQGCFWHCSWYNKCRLSWEACQLDTCPIQEHLPLADKAKGGQRPQYIIGCKD